jgi:hypothetical protein
MHAAATSPTARAAATVSGDGAQLTIALSRSPSNAVGDPRVYPTVGVVSADSQPQLCATSKLNVSQHAATTATGCSQYAQLGDRVVQLRAIRQCWAEINKMAARRALIAVAAQAATNARRASAGTRQAASAAHTSPLPDAC